MGTYYRLFAGGVHTAFHSSFDEEVVVYRLGVAVPGRGARAICLTARGLEWGRVDYYSEGGVDSYVFFPGRIVALS